MTEPTAPRPESTPAPASNPAPAPEASAVDSYDHFLELQADALVCPGLTDAQTQTMQSLAEQHPDWARDPGLEHAAAWLTLRDTPAVPVPDELRRKLLTAADHQIAALAPDPAGRGVTPPAPPPAAPPPAAADPRRRTVLAFLGGAMTGAVAAALLLALLLSQPAPTRPPIDDAPPRLTADAPGTRFAAFQAVADDARTFAWTKTQPDFQDVTGWVLWSPRLQTGYLVFDRLPAQDPDQQQYQLWIVDPTRDQLPVDGGVFDVQPHTDPDGRVYVPIQAKLPIDDPQAFAVTLEKPGGVVKSAGPLLVTAPTS